MLKKKLHFKLPFKIKWPQIKLPQLAKIKSASWRKKIFPSIKEFFFTKIKQFKKLPLKKKIIYLTTSALVLILLIALSTFFLIKFTQKKEGQTEGTPGAEETLEIGEELKAEDYDYTDWQTYEGENYSIQCPSTWYCDQVISPFAPEGPIIEYLTIFIYQDHQPSWDYFESQMQNEENEKGKIKIGEYELEKVEFEVMDKKHIDYRLELEGKRFTINVVTPKDKDQGEYLNPVSQILASFKVL